MLNKLLFIQFFISLSLIVACKGQEVTRIEKYQINATASETVRFSYSFNDSTKIDAECKDVGTYYSVLCKYYTVTKKQEYDSLFSKHSHQKGTGWSDLYEHHNRVVNEHANILGYLEITHRDTTYVICLAEKSNILGDSYRENIFLLVNETGEPYNRQWLLTDNLPNPYKNLLTICKTVPNAQIIEALTIFNNVTNKLPAPKTPIVYNLGWGLTLDLTQLNKRLHYDKKIN